MPKRLLSRRSICSSFAGCCFISDSTSCKPATDSFGQCRGNLELGFAEPAYIICETVTEDVPWRKEIVQEGFEIDPSTRTVRPNAKPGLGIEINEEKVKEYPFQQEVLQRVFYKDGAVGDW